MAAYRPLGCSHYDRKCDFVTPCCMKVYTCRFCHDENEDHSVNRKAIMEIICQMCDNKQMVHSKCLGCGIKFGEYTCLICNLFDDVDKGQFHCSQCGICRVGGEDNFYHCDKCNLCLNITLIEDHKCVENASRSDCPVCLEDLHTSRLALQYLSNCGHFLHKECFDQLEKAEHSACPTCKTPFKKPVPDRDLVLDKARFYH